MKISGSRGSHMPPGIPAALTILLACAIIFSGCTGTPAHPPPGLQPDPSGITLPESRPFFMGFTPTPYDISGQAVTDTYQFLGEHGDIICHHFDQGVPWPEARANGSYKQKVRDDINLRTSHRVAGQKVYLALTPLVSGRDGLALYWGEQENLPMPEGWSGKSFDDPEVISAYTNYCRSMIQEFHPDYLAYGIEVNILAKKDPEEFEKFTILARQVYTTLKEENPDLPVFQTFHIDTYAGDPQLQQEAISRLLPYTDYVAVSTYPFTYREDPDDLPHDWFEQMHALAPEKPFGVAETGFSAEDVDLQKYRFSVKGSPERQSRYVALLLDNAGRLDARFVIWFVPEDYDPLWDKLHAMGADELVKLWKDCGLADSSQNPRPSLSVWDAWYRLPVR